MGNEAFKKINCSLTWQIPVSWCGIIWLLASASRGIEKYILDMSSNKDRGQEHEDEEEVITLSQKTCSGLYTVWTKRDYKNTMFIYVNKKALMHC